MVDTQETYHARLHADPWHFYSQFRERLPANLPLDRPHQRSGPREADDVTVFWVAGADGASIWPEVNQLCVFNRSGFEQKIPRILEAWERLGDGHLRFVVQTTSSDISSTSIRLLLRNEPKEITESAFATEELKASWSRLVELRAGKEKQSAAEQDLLASLSRETTRITTEHLEALYPDVTRPALDEMRRLHFYRPPAYRPYEFERPFSEPLNQRADLEEVFPAALLTEFLRRSTYGLLAADASVLSFKANRIGKGTGFRSKVYRLFDIVTEPPMKIDSLVLKTPHWPLPDARYWNYTVAENLFYESVFPFRHSLRTPLCWFSAHSDGLWDTSRVEHGGVWRNGLPVEPRTDRHATASSVLLLEDLSTAKWFHWGDTVDLELGLVGAVALARFHAEQRTQPASELAPFAPRLDSSQMIDFFVHHFSRFWQYTEHVTLPTFGKAWFEWCADYERNIPQLLKDLCDPEHLVLCHGDVFINNLCFPSRPQPDPLMAYYGVTEPRDMCLLDWQTMFLGDGLVDLAAFIDSGLLHSHEDRLLAAYTNALGRAGWPSRQLDPDRIWARFQMAKRWSFIMHHPIMGASLIFTPKLFSADSLFSLRNR